MKVEKRVQGIKAIFTPRKVFIFHHYNMGNVMRVDMVAFETEDCREVLKLLIPR